MTAYITGDEFIAALVDELPLFLPPPGEHPIHVRLGVVPAKLLERVCALHRLVVLHIEQGDGANPSEAVYTICDSAVRQQP